MGLIEKIIETVFVNAAVDGALKTMDREGKKPGERLFGDILVLRFNIVIKMLIYGYLILSLFLGVLGIFTIESRLDLYIYIGLMFFLLILNILFFSAGRNVRIEVDNRNITKYGVFGKAKQIWWNEIKRVKIIPGNKTATITGDKMKIRVNSNFIGYNDFLEYVKEKVDPGVLQVVERSR